MPWLSNPYRMPISRSAFALRSRASTRCATLGAELTMVTPGIVEIEMPFSAALTQQHGFLHAGVISTALDWPAAMPPSR